MKHSTKAFNRSMARQIKMKQKRLKREKGIRMIFYIKSVFGPKYQSMNINGLDYEFYHGCVTPVLMEDYKQVMQILELSRVDK